MREGLLEKRKLLLAAQLDVYFTQLLLGHLVGSAHEQILCVGVHREGDNLADILLR